MKLNDIVNIANAVYLTIGILFIVISYRIYVNFVDKKKKKPDVANANRQIVTIDVYFFSLDWCPYCTTAAPVWRSFVDKYDKEVMGGYQINCVGGKNGSNCTDEYNPDVADLITRFSLTSYPCIKFVKDEVVIDFAAKITEDNMKNCLNNVVNEN